MAHLYDFFTQNPVGYAVGLVLALMAVVKKEWGQNLGYLILLAAWLMIVCSAMNTFKDWRSTACAACFVAASLFALSIWLWPRKVAGRPASLNEDPKTASNRPHTVLATSLEIRLEVDRIRIPWVSVGFRCRNSGSQVIKITEYRAGSYTDRDPRYYDVKGNNPRTFRKNLNANQLRWMPKVTKPIDLAPGESLVLNKSDILVTDTNLKISPQELNDDFFYSKRTLIFALKIRYKDSDHVFEQRFSARIESEAFSPMATSYQTTIPDIDRFVNGIGKLEYPFPDFDKPQW